MYSRFAPIYDLAQQGRFGQQMAAWSLGWLAERGERPQRVLDLACGTGAATLVFAQAGCQVTGVDASAPMLAIAQAKARDAALTVEWLQADLRTLTVEQIGHYQLVTCFGGVNELTGDGDLARMFNVAAQALEPGGYLMFDVNSEQEYTSWDERDDVLFDSDGALVYQKLHFNRRSRRGTRKLGWFVREIDSWWRDEEQHTQRAWRERELRTALGAAGLAIELVELVQHKLVFVARRSA